MSQDLLSSLFNESASIGGEDEDIWSAIASGKQKNELQSPTGHPQVLEQQIYPQQGNKVPEQGEIFTQQVTIFPQQVPIFPEQVIEQEIFFSVDQRTLVPVGFPSPVRPLSLIAARRMQQRNEEAVIQPEQDVIYRSSNVMSSPHPPPSPSILPPINSAKSSVKHFSTIAPPVVAPAPFVNSHLHPPEIQVAQNGIDKAQNTKAKQGGGLRVFCNFGFGGRLILGGGRFGSRLAMPTIRSFFSEAKSTRQLISDIQSLPCPLGNVTPLTTEQIISYCRRSEEVDLDRFGSRSSKDSRLLWSFLGSLAAGGGSRLEFLTSLWQEAVDEYKIEKNSHLSQFSQHIVTGNMSECIGMAKLNSKLFPLAMAVASIHSAEYFRECILAYTVSLGNEESLTNPAYSSSSSDKELLDCVKLCVTAFASTANIDSVLSDSISEKVSRYWKLYAVLIGSLIKKPLPNLDTSSTGSGGVSFLIKLGQLLCSSRNVCGGHLCMLLSGKISGLESVDSGDSLISLLGADHRNIAHFHRLLDVGPLQLSEVYEYVVRATDPQNNAFFIPLQPWKFAYASLLCDLGLFELAEKYLQVINAFARAVPTNKYTAFFRSSLRELESRISLPPREPIPGVGQTAIGAIWGGIRAVAAQTSSRIL